MSEFWCVTHVVFTTSKRLPLIFFGAEQYETKPEDVSYEERTRSIYVNWFDNEDDARRHYNVLNGKLLLLEREKRLYAR